MENTILIVSLILNTLLGLKPVIMFIVKKTKTTKDDELVEKIFSLLDKLPDKKKEEILEKIR